VCSVCRKSLDLIDILLQLADEGFHSLVLELFKFPVQYCPDLLLLGLLQIVRTFTYLFNMENPTKYTIENKKESENI